MVAREWVLLGVALSALWLCAAGAQADVIGLEGRYVRVIKTDGTINPGDGNRFHIGEIEVFADSALPAVAGLDNANDLALSSKGAVGSTVSGTPQHGNDSALVNGAVDGGATTWSRQNPLPIIAQVDLGASYTIGNIRVWQRGDGCCQERLESFSIELLADASGSPGAVVYSENHPGRAVPTNWYSQFNLGTVNPGGLGIVGNDDLSATDVTAPGVVAGAKAVRLIQNVADTFQIAEIQALEQSTGTNVALNTNGGVATASTSGYGTNPTRAIDGGSPILQNYPNLWHSSDALGAWVQVDFASPTTLDQFHIYGRSDCCHNRQDNFDLVLYDGSGTEIHRQQVLGLGSGPGQNRLFDLETPTGDTLGTLLPYLHVFEVDATNLTADTVTLPDHGGTSTLDLTDAVIEMAVINGDPWNLNGLTFQILVADQFTGTPASVTAPGLPQGFWLESGRLAQDGTVTFRTPEPTTLSLLALGGLALLRRRRKAPSSK